MVVTRQIRSDRPGSDGPAPQDAGQPVQATRSPRTGSRCVALDGTTFDGARVPVQGTDRHRVLQGSGRCGEGRRRAFAKDNEKLTIVGGALGDQHAGRRRRPGARHAAVARCSARQDHRSDPGPGDEDRGRAAGTGWSARSGVRRVRSQGRRREGGVGRDSYRHHDYQKFGILGDTTMANLEKLVEELSTLTVLEAAELSKMLEEKWGVCAAAPVAVAAAAGRAAAAPAEVKDEFTVMLAAAGDKKINVIKEVRDDHRPRPQGGQGPGRGRAEAGQGRRAEGRRREDQGASSRPRAPRSNSSKRQFRSPDRPPRGRSCSGPLVQAGRRIRFDKWPSATDGTSGLAGREFRDSSG